MFNLLRFAQSRPDNSAAVRANRSAVREITLQVAREKGIEITPSGDLVLYHGTSPRNAQLISRTGALHMGTYFASDEATAKMFAGQATRRGEPVVMKVAVDPSAIFGGSYWSLNEEVRLGPDGVYRPR